MNFNDVAIVSVKRSDYRIHFWYMSKDDVMNLMEIVDCYKFLLYIKMSDKTNYYKKSKRKL